LCVTTTQLTSGSEASPGARAAGGVWGWEGMRQGPVTANIGAARGALERPLKLRAGLPTTGA
jgi:hypothetical protein